MEQLLLPKFDYYLDKSDPDIVILRRQDGAFVAAFSARGTTREGVVEAAKAQRLDLSRFLFLYSPKLVEGDSQNVAAHLLNMCQRLHV